MMCVLFQGRVSLSLCGGILCVILVFFQSKYTQLDQAGGLRRGGGGFYSKEKTLAVNQTRRQEDEPIAVVPSKVQRLYWKSEWDQVQAIDGSDVLDFDAPRPKHLRLAFIGDSLARYQYLSLVHFLKFGHFPDPHEQPSFVYRIDKLKYNEFFSYTNSKLAPYEQCDCYRDEMGSSQENRYFYDNRTDNLVVHLTKFGEGRVRISVPPSEVDFRNHTAYTHLPTNYTKAKSWAKAIRHLASLPIKPTHVILNAGLSEHDLDSRSVRKGIAKELQRYGMIGIYKTTTCTSREAFQGEKNPHPNRLYEDTDDDLSAYEAKMCKLLGHCMSTGWTCNVVQEKFVDNCHFDEPIYKRLNLQMLDILDRMQ